MHQVLSWVLSWIGLRVLGLRYRIHSQALCSLAKETKKGLLFLPNHPAQIDPIILSVLLFKRFRTRPLVSESFYSLKGGHFFMRLLRALPLPDFDLPANKWKVHQVEKCLEEVKRSLKKGENFLIYPAGHLKSEGDEIVGGSSFVHHILQSCPEVKVVLLRTVGLWGSTFSRAITGRSPDFWKVLGKGGKHILKNGIFLTPRRKVEIDMSFDPDDFPYRGSRLEINTYLEKWYNHYLDQEGRRVDKEPLTLVSLSRFSRVFPTMTKQHKKKEKKKELDIPQKIRDDLYREIAKLSGCHPSKIGEEMELSRDLGLDSLDLVTIQAFLDKRYDIEIRAPDQLQRVRDLFELILEETSPPPPLPSSSEPPLLWPQEPFRPEIKLPKGNTLQEVFLLSTERMGKSIACGDELTGFLSYKQLRVDVMVLARKFEELPGESIGVLLPSSVGSYLVVLALLFAGKIPVILNWTAGVRTLNFAKELLSLQVVVSSRHFLGRVDSLDLGALEENLLLMEELKRELSLFDRGAGLFLAKKKTSSLSERFNLRKISKEDPAVILFTSGTQTHPKAVPLSHKNLLSSQRGALELTHFPKEEILYGVLPPFHSFGLNVTGLFPLLTGLKVFYAPDPTNTHRMIRDISCRKITFLCLTPSFYRHLFRIATPRQLRTVSLFVSGAEKAPKELFEWVEELGEGRELIEGYGVTECSPIVTMNQRGQPTRGVGRSLPGTKLCIIHPETTEVLEGGKQGEICVHGPTVFNGYLGEGVSNPFIEIDGERWYRSGDLGQIDQEGFLFLGGRLKRFVKIGGEMVSLAALEEELTTCAKNKHWIPNDKGLCPLVIGVLERALDKPLLILFTTFPVQKEAVNSALREVGFGRIVKVGEVRQVPQIPLTGTGKVHFRKIDEWIRDG